MRQKTVVLRVIAKCDRKLLQSASDIPKCGSLLLQSLFRRC